MTFAIPVSFKERFKVKIAIDVKDSTKNFEEKVIVTAHYEHANVRINVEKITLIPYERANVRKMSRR